MMIPIICLAVAMVLTFAVLILEQD
jgi:hypothetical protein